MKAAFALLVGTLAPTVAPAQSATPAKTLIALYEQASGNLLAAEQRVYTAYFNTMRTRTVAVAITMEYPPPQQHPG